MVIKSLLQRKIIELPALNVIHIYGGVFLFKKVGGKIHPPFC